MSNEKGLVKADQQLLHEGVEQFLLEVFLRLRLKLVAQHPTPGLVGHVALAVRFVAAVLRKGLLTPVLRIIHSGDKSTAMQRSPDDSQHILAAWEQLGTIVNIFRQILSLCSFTKLASFLD